MDIAHKLKRKARTFLHTSFRFKLLVVSIFILSGFARLCIVTLPLNKILRTFGVLHKNYLLSTVLTPDTQYKALRLKQAVKMGCKYTPWKSTCLVEAMAAKFWCQHFSIPFVFYIGFRKDVSKPNGFGSHAWLTAGPIAISGGHSFSEFSVILTYLKKG